MVPRERCSLNSPIVWSLNSTLIKIVSFSLTTFSPLLKVSIVLQCANVTFLVSMCSVFLKLKKVECIKQNMYTRDKAKIHLFIFLLSRLDFWGIPIQKIQRSLNWQLWDKRMMGSKICTFFLFQSTVNMYHLRRCVFFVHF